MQMFSQYWLVLSVLPASLDDSMEIDHHKCTKDMCMARIAAVKTPSLVHMYGTNRSQRDKSNS